MLLHGLDTTAEQWRPVGVALAKRNKVVVLDLLGFGASHEELSSRFSLEDHAAAVWATVKTLFGEQPVRFVGHGLGAAIALACAAEQSGAVSEVVAFSPTLAPPTGTDPGAATQLDASLALLREEGGRRSAQLLAVEALADRVVPALRSLSSVLDSDAERLLDRVRAPVVVVAPDADDVTPKAWLRAYASRHPDRISVVAVEGRRLLPFEDPPTAAKLIDPGFEEVLKAARREAPIDVRKTRLFDDMRRGDTSLHFRRGALMLLGGLTLVVAPVLAGRLTLQALTIALLVESLLAVAGAFGLRGRGRHWSGWLLAGLVSFAFALYATIAYALAMPFSAAATGVWLLARGSADLLIALQAHGASRHRRLLVAQAALGAAAAVLSLLAAATPGPLLRYMLGGYFALAGVLTLGYGWARHRAILRQLRSVLGSS